MNPSPADLVRDDMKTVEVRMREFPVPPARLIAETLDRLLAAGGKRLRPTLSLLFGRMLRVPDDPLIHFSASLEMLHTATLVHDDLVDGSPVRRGVSDGEFQLSGGDGGAGRRLPVCVCRPARRSGRIPVGYAEIR